MLRGQSNSSEEELKKESEPSQHNNYLGHQTIDLIERDISKKA